MALDLITPQQQLSILSPNKMQEGLYQYFENMICAFGKSLKKEHLGTFLFEKSVEQSAKKVKMCLYKLLLLPILK